MVKGPNSPSDPRSMASCIHFFPLGLFNVHRLSKKEVFLLVAFISISKIINFIITWVLLSGKQLISVETISIFYLGEMETGGRLRPPFFV